MSHPVISALTQSRRHDYANLAGGCCWPGRGKLKIRVKSGHKPKRHRKRPTSEKGNLCGHRRALPILLKIRACLATIGEPISGHPGEQPPAGVGVEPLTVIDGLNQVIV